PARPPHPARWVALPPRGVPDPPRLPPRGGGPRRRRGVLARRRDELPGRILVPPRPPRRGGGRGRGHLRRRQRAAPGRGGAPRDGGEAPGPLAPPGRGPGGGAEAPGPRT